MSNGEPQAVSRPQTSKAAKSGMGLRLYKPGQGYYTRLGTVIGAGTLVLAGAGFLFNQVAGHMDLNSPYFYAVQWSLIVVWLLIMSGLIYWVVGLNRTAADFFIATEGEMKKVSWSTRQEVIRSTKVVVVCVFLFGAILFAADLLFMTFFSEIGVLKMTTRLFGGGGS